MNNILSKSNITVTQLGLLQFIADSNDNGKTLNWEQWLQSAEAKHNHGTLAELQGAGLIAVGPVGVSKADTFIRLTADGGELLISMGYGVKLIKRQPTQPTAQPKPAATTVADIISAVSQRTITLDREAKRDMTALRNRLGLASLDDVLVVSLHLTKTLLDALPADGVLRMVNEDGESVQTLKILP